MAIWHTLCIRGEVKMKNLAVEYNVSWLTIFRDIEVLSLTYPIVTIRGKHGGVKLPDWYTPGKNHLTPEQIDFLENLYRSMSSSDAAMMKSIIQTLATK